MVLLIGFDALMTEMGIFKTLKIKRLLRFVLITDLFQVFVVL